ncbi:uncharacterized protein LOC130052168 [Ostrea edulis]|uniref:uncharacterized protein LOC130052165 n=1 Tax=Ostrea edulis TaxID=37623 RepID=UPI0024AFED6B|nr:uncharacterized protein LOC130052165 [Ostrea edulis]XP_056012375.1 uncharacterized protein LOC130052168 [Ostrea edulis]
MIATFLYVFLLMTGVELSKHRGSQIPCSFGEYDLNRDGIILITEFLYAADGYEKMSPETIFNTLDKNHDGKVMRVEFIKPSPGLSRKGIFDHCKRRKPCIWDCDGCSNC